MTSSPRSQFMVSKSCTVGYCRATNVLLGAKFYYLHFVLHDWSDDRCQTILTELVRVMKPGFSKILINENVVPDQNAHWFATGLDLLVMVLGAASERTEKQWEYLLNSVGLRIVKIWRHPEATESLIEADLWV